MSGRWADPQKHSVAARDMASRMARMPVAGATLTAWCLLGTACGPIRTAEGAAGSGGAVMAAPVELVPGVVFDREREAFYVMTPAGAVDCVDVPTGSARWTSGDAARPLAAGHGLLLAQAEAATRPAMLALVGLDVADGQRVGRVELPLPAGIDADIDERLEASFGIEARSLPDGFHVAWRATWQPIGGAEPGASGFTQAHGSARIDPQTWLATPVPAGGAEPPARELPAAVQRLVADGTLPGPLWNAGGVVATVTRSTEAAGDPVVLRRCRADDGGPLPDVPLARGFIVQFPSADGRTLLASRPDDTDPRGEAWTWLLIALESGEREVELRRPTLSEPFVLAGDVLVVVSGTAESRCLLAVDAGTGRERWRRPLRDTSYRGPVPNAPPAGR